MPRRYVSLLQERAEKDKLDLAAKKEKQKQVEAEAKMATKAAKEEAAAVAKATREEAAAAAKAEKEEAKAASEPPTPCLPPPPSVCCFLGTILGRFAAHLPNRAHGANRAWRRVAPPLLARPAAVSFRGAALGANFSTDRCAS